MKTADLKTTLQPHQQRVVDRIQDPDQTGLVVAHGLGSGKSLASIASQDALQMPATVVLPAALQANYQKERAKHLTGAVQPADIQSIQAAARTGTVASNPLLIVDEAHRLREPTKSRQAVEQSGAKKRLLLTGTPFYNRPSDIAPLINIAAAKRVLPQDAAEFEKRYVAEKKIDPSLWGRVWRHETPGVEQSLNERTSPELLGAFKKYVDYHAGSQDEFPSVTRQTVQVPMSKEQLHLYDALIGKAPPWVAAKIKSGLPPSKRESQELNAFLTAARQASNTTQPFIQEGTAHSPKIQQAFEALKGNLAADPTSKAVVYSNYLDAGVSPYRTLLQKSGIPFGEFTGEMPKKQRDALVQQYNEGKLRTLLLSSAGGEGLDLKGTRLMQILDPHWNWEKLKQVEGRAIRYRSHADLPEDKRNVLVQQYLATRPKDSILERLGVKEPGGAVDQYLAGMSDKKERLIGQFRGLMARAQKDSDTARGGSKSA